MIAFVLEFHGTALHLHKQAPPILQEVMACESGIILVAGNEPAETIKTAGIRKTKAHQEHIFVFPITIHYKR